MDEGMTNPRAHELRDCPRFYNCLTQAALKSLSTVPCKECKNKQEVEMAKSPQVTCSRETYRRLEKIRKESKMKWVDFLKLCCVSRSQWDCIRNSKPMGQVVFERIADNLKINYDWMVRGTGPAPDKINRIAPEPVHDAGYLLPEEKKIQAVAEEISSDTLGVEAVPDEPKSVKTLECYEFAKDGHMAKIWLGGAGSFKYATVNAVQKEWTYDDWMFLGEVAQEIKRLVQG